MKVDHFQNPVGPWMRGNGPQSDIVISSRVRLARNVAEFPFIMRCNEFDRANIEATVSRRLREMPVASTCDYFNVATLKAVDRQYLVERQLISRELSENQGARGVLVDRDENFSVMINEEDHLRIQVMRSGLDFEDAFQQIEVLDDAIDEKVCYAFHSQYGYLTACPTNVGTGMRVSVMLHLPALVLTKQIEKVFRSLQKINLAVRGLYGEGSQAMGDFYQISNQITLGRSEYELIKQVGDVVPVIISYERKARHFLLQDSRDDLERQVRKALGTLQKAGQISSEETMHLLSKIRLGVNLGLLNDLDIPTINRLFVYTQPAHLQKIRGSEMDTTQRNKARAAYLHSQLELPSGDAPQS